MILQNLLHRPVRTTITILGVSFEVAMVMLVVGLSHGMLRASAARILGVGGDVMVEPPGASLFMGLTSGTLPMSLIGRFSKLDQVEAVTPVFFRFTNLGTRLIWGIDMKSWNRVTGGFTYLAGGPFEGPYDILVDNDYARQDNVRVGQSLNLLNHAFRVCGIVEHGKGSRLFIPLQTAEHLAGQHDRVSIFFIKCTLPRYAGNVVRSIKKLYPEDSALAVRQYMSMLTTDPVSPLRDFVTVMVSTAVTIGFLMIFLSMYTTVAERTREMGLLKSLGASQGYIVRLIVKEAMALSVIGVLVGYSATWAGWWMIRRTYPTISVELTLGWAGWAGMLALGGSLLGAFYPAWRAAGLDPVDALACE
jgi:putative ABC transport system permease protein